ncbi:MAG: hypothetical protein OXI75_00755 [Rhodospirillales bacterium]|nr:hypothetical protein [Rhodospirillales bacterium]
MIFGDNHALTETLEAVDEELVEWRQWAQTHGILADASNGGEEVADTP